MSTDALMQQFHSTLSKCELLREQDVRLLCSKAKEIFTSEANMTTVAAPATIAGDIHGQFYDLIELFKVGGDVPGTNYVFMGDIVDRGYHSVECFSLLLVLKVRYPRKVTLLRGNHESRQITQIHGMYDEVIRKYGSASVWRYFVEVFDYLPLVALIEEKVFCVHAGLSPSVDTLDHIQSIHRRCEIPVEGPMCDLLWSDPEECIEGWGMSHRGAGYLFGKDVVHQFNHTNKLSLVCRSHQLVMEGHKSLFDDTFVTVWSAPNYVYRCGNDASILELDEHLNRKFAVFQQAPDGAHQSTEKNALPEYFL